MYVLTYTAAYRTFEEGVHAEVLDFPGVLTCGRDLDHARLMLSGALVDMAETCLLQGAALPLPVPDLTDDEAELVEPIHLVLLASSTVSVLPGHAA